MSVVDPRKQLAEALRAQARALDAIAEAVSAISGQPTVAPATATEWVTKANYAMLWPAKSWRSVIEYAERRGVEKHKLGQAVAFKLAELTASSSAAKAKPMRVDSDAEYEAIAAQIARKRQRRAA